LGLGTSLSLFDYKDLLTWVSPYECKEGSCNNLLDFWKYNSPSAGTITITPTPTILSKAKEQAFIDRGEGDKINH